MQILNETVYYTDDLRAVIEHVQERTFARRVANAQDQKRRYPQNKIAVPTQPPALPEAIRFGYYNNPKEKHKGAKGVSVSYVSRQGGRYWNENTIRIGIAPLDKLPLTAMQVIARAATEDDRVRSLPREVLTDLAYTLMAALFTEHLPRNDENTAWLLKGCPDVRYGFDPDKENAKASKALARQERLERLRKRVGWSEARLVSLKEKLVKEEAKLAKLKAALAKAEGRKEMGYVPSQ